MTALTINKLVFFSFLVMISSQLSNVLAESKSEKFNKVIKPYVENNVFSGTVLVSKNGNIIYQQAFGLANYSWSISNTPDTKFGIGSISKTITAVIVMQLVQEGKLTLSDSIEHYLPNYPSDKGKQITVHHLLSHRSGMPNYFKIPGWTNGEFNKSMSLVDFEQVLNKLPLGFSPGSSRMYSNTGYFFLGRIIEKVTGISFADNLRSRIFEPTKMHNSGIHYDQSVIDKFATGYQLGMSGGFRESVINRNLFRAAGDLYSTSKDLYLFVQAFNTDKFLSPKSKETLLLPENSYGWEQLTLSIASQQKRVITYSGQLLGYNAILTQFPDSNSSIILLGNIGTSAGERFELTSEIANILFDVEFEEHKLRYSMRLHRALFENNFFSVINQLNKIQFEYDSNGLKSLAQQLVWSRKSKEAKAIERLIDKENE